MATAPHSIFVDLPFERELSTFREVDSSIPVYVPASSVEDYRNSEWGKQFRNIKPM